jgi:chromosomal replication initiation ATPase DnaA
MKNGNKFKEFGEFLTDAPTYESLLAAVDFACSDNHEIPVLLIDGAEGLGKKSITNTIINKYKEVYSEKVTTHFWTGKDITDFYIKMLHGAKIPDFIDAIIKPDILIISDINYLEGKYETTAALLGCLKKRFEKNKFKLVIITGDIKKMNWEKSANELLNGAFRLELPFPGFYIRREIVARTFEKNNLNPDENIIELIADKVISNVSVLKAIVEELSVKEKTAESPLTYCIVKTALSKRVILFGDYV